MNMRVFVAALSAALSAALLLGSASGVSAQQLPLGPLLQMQRQVPATQQANPPGMDEPKTIRTQPGKPAGVTVPRNADNPHRSRTPRYFGGRSNDNG
jgi:hypothetical protein